MSLSVIELVGGVELTRMLLSLLYLRRGAAVSLLAEHGVGLEAGGGGARPVAVHLNEGGRRG